MSELRFVHWIATTAREAAWAPVFVVTLHALAVFAFDGYHRFPPLDRVMHFGGGVAIAYFWHRASINASRFGLIGPYHPVTHAVLVGSLVCVAAVAWEFAEFVLDRAFGTRYQPGVGDTMIDLLLGNAGGAAFLAGAGRLGRLRNRSD